MTTARQIKGLSASLLARHPDLIDSGKNTLWLTPINHVGRLILIDRTSNPAYCVVSWHLVELFMPQYTSWNCLGRCGDRVFRSKHYRGGQGWFWSDPTIYQDFVNRVEAEALPLFRSLNTTRRCLEFPRSHPHWSGFLDHHWHVAACIALGEIERAQELWSEIRRRYVEEEPSENRAEQQRHRRFRELDRPLRAGDRAALSALLARWEAENVVGTPLEPHWQRAGFPLDDVC